MWSVLNFIPKIKLNKWSKIAYKPDNVTYVKWMNVLFDIFEVIILMVEIESSSVSSAKKKVFTFITLFSEFSQVTWDRFCLMSKNSFFLLTWYVNHKEVSFQQQFNNNNINDNECYIYYLSLIRKEFIRNKKLSYLYSVNNNQSCSSVRLCYALHHWHQLNWLIAWMEILIHIHYKHQILKHISHNILMDKVLVVQKMAKI